MPGNRHDFDHFHEIVDYLWETRNDPHPSLKIRNDSEASHVSFPLIQFPDYGGLPNHLWENMSVDFVYDADAAILSLWMGREIDSKDKLFTYLKLALFGDIPDEVFPKSTPSSNTPARQG